jgi:hypothetical protein
MGRGLVMIRGGEATAGPPPLTLLVVLLEQIEVVVRMMVEWEPEQPPGLGGGRLGGADIRGCGAKYIIFVPRYIWGGDVHTPGPLKECIGGVNWSGYQSFHTRPVTVGPQEQEA